LQSGTPVELPFIEQTPTLLQMWYGGQELGIAIADVMFGDRNPSGKLSLTWPKRVQDNPAYLNFGRSDKGAVTYGEGIWAGWKWYEALDLKPEFPFGYFASFGKIVDVSHGLSYTTFEYSNLTVDKNVIGEDEGLEATIQIKNVGSVAGAEVVQFYISDLTSTIKRPLKELKGFDKAYLKPGETSTVKFVVDKYSISYFDEDKMSWIAEAGKFSLCVGQSSVEIKAKVDFELSVTYWWTGL
jgi:beta-glucosidase